MISKTSVVIKNTACVLFSVLLGVTPVVARTNVSLQPSVQTVKKVDNVQLYNEAIAFLNTLHPEDYKTWNHPFYVITKQQEDEMREYLDNYIIKGLTNEYDKAKTIFNWVHKNVAYAFDVSKAYLHPYDIFKHKSAVCGGYSNLYKALLNLAGIPAVNVSGILTSVGETAGHEWNAIYVDGRWMYADATWGNEHFDNEPLFSNQYQTIGIYQAFQQVQGLKIGFDEGVALVGVDPVITNVTIPTSYENLPVSVISDQFFQTAYEARQLYVPETIRKIKVSSGASKLEKIVVDEKNTAYASVDDVLFTNDLTTILLYPENKMSTSFTIPAQTMNYDFKETFANMYLETIQVDPANPYFASYDGAVYESGYQELYTVGYAKQHLRVKGGSKLNNFALSFKDNLQSVVLEDGIVDIPEGAFAYCSSLKELEIPSSVTQIHPNAFEQVNLSQLVIKGYANSCAEQFAKERNITFVLLQEESVAPTKENLAKLQEEIKSAKAFDISAYTPESVASFQTAIALAEDDLRRYQKGEGSNEDCLHSIKELQDSYAFLVKKAIHLSTYSISMKGNVALNLYLEIEKEVFEDVQASIVFTREDQSEERVLVRDLSSIQHGDKTLYKVEVPMLAKQMNDLVSSKAYYKDSKTGEQKELVFQSVKIQDYAKDVLSASDDAFKKGTKEAVIAMLNYGAKAQVYFNYKKDQLVNDFLDVSLKENVVKEEDFDAYKPSYDGDLEGLNYAGSSVLIQSDNTIHHYFKITNNAKIDDFTFSINQQEVKPKVNGDYYYISLDNINAKDLGVMNTVVIRNALNQEVKLDYSVLSYGYLVFQGQQPVALQELVKSLYSYHMAAKFYAQK